MRYKTKRQDMLPVPGLCGDPKPHASHWLFPRHGIDWVCGGVEKPKPKVRDDSNCILFKELTNADRHRLGDHRGCGHACSYTGVDRREEPIYTMRVLVRVELAFLSRAELFARAKKVGVQVPFNATKEQLIQLLAPRTPHIGVH